METTEMRLPGLSFFSQAGECSPDLKVAALNSSIVKRVICFALGPKGNNIEQAANLWIKKMGIIAKAKVVLCSTPELCLESARKVDEDGVLSVFWTCAVYVKENEFFFTNPDVYPFFFQQEMLLDGMQLAAKSSFVARLQHGIPRDMKIASHPSPAPLVRNLKSAQIVLCDSNAAAAKACINGKAELCITTESARKINGLTKVHSFGSPNMVFFGGITRHGLIQIKNVFGLSE